MIRYQMSHFIPYIHHDVEVVFDMNGGIYPSKYTSKCH